MLIFPTTTVADLITSIESVVADNAAVMVGVIGVAIGARLLFGLVFKRGTNKIKA
jgi:hypothetical protein